MCAKFQNFPPIFGKEEELFKACRAVREALKELPEDSESDPDEDGFAEAAEGKLLTKLHKRRERSLKLVNAKKKWAMNKLGALKCEACDFDLLWIDGKFPLKEKQDRKVKAKLSGKSDSNFPPVFEIGDLLCGERQHPLPPQHAITLMLEYVHSITPAPAVVTDGLVYHAGLAKDWADSHSPSCRGYRADSGCHG